MPRRKSRTLTELELEFMNVLWDHGASGVAQIRRALKERGHDLARASVRTMLAVLEEKGYAARGVEGRRPVYRPLISREQAQQSILRDVVDRAFGGSALDLVVALVDTRMMAEGDAQKVRALIEEAERKRSR